MKIMQNCQQNRGQLWAVATQGFRQISVPAASMKRGKVSHVAAPEPPSHVGQGEGSHESSLDGAS